MNKVFVLGAGFTKAFAPDAPLMIDDYCGRELHEKYAHFPAAKKLIDAGMERNGGLIDIERVLTRLDARMPYDFEQGVGDELGLLLSDFKSCLVDKISAALAKDVEKGGLRPYREILR